MARTSIFLFCAILVCGYGRGGAQPGYELRNFFVDDPLGIITGDFNNDGYVDIAIGDDFVFIGGTHQIQVLLNDGMGYFTRVLSRREISAVHNEIVAGHFDGDNLLDIVEPCGANFQGRGAIMPFEGVGDGTFLWTVKFYNTYTDWPNWITAADFDRNGKLDVAVAATKIDDPVLPGRDLVSVLLVSCIINNLTM